MKNCQQCGKCCRDITLPLDFYPDEDDIRWIEYHKGLEVKEIDGKFKIKINIPCSKLVKNKCSVHKTRPENCQIFVCQK